MTKRIVSLIACGLLASCGGKEPLSEDIDDKYAVAASCRPAQLAATLDAHTEATLVVDLGSGSKGYAKAIKDSKRKTPPFGITVGLRPDDGDEIPDVLIAVDHGASAAVDLALVACNGSELRPNCLEIGTRTFTSANRKAGGVPRVAPGDVILAMMKLEHGETLSTKPTTDQVHTVGLVLCDAGAVWQTELHAAIKAAVARYPQLRLATADAQLPPAEQASHLLSQACSALLVATTDVAHSKAVRTDAVKGPYEGTQIIVLDPTVNVAHELPVVGCSADTVGEAVAVAAQELLPEGGTMVTCFEDDATERLMAFCAAMRLPHKALLKR